MNRSADHSGSNRTSVLRPGVIAWAVLGSILVSFVAVVVAAEDATSLAGRVGGDFPAFYGAGSVVRDGDVEQLYELRRQATAQDEIMPGGDSLLYFAYPPPVAAAYSVLAALPYVGAYVLHTALMLGALLLGLRLIRPLIPDPPLDRSVVVAVTLTFVPLFMGVTLGQNSALVFLLVAASWRLAHDGRPELTGLVLGLLLFKPQYALPLIGLHLLRGRWRIPAASALMAVAWWAVGALMLGTSWLTEWFDQVGEFTAVDAEVNGANAVSWLGIAEHVLGVGSTAAIVVGGLLIVATVGVLALVWWRADDHRLAVPMAAAAAGILLASPHAMFYDAGLLVITVAGVWGSGRVASIGPLIAIGWVLGALHPLKGVLGATPVSLAVIGGFIAAAVAWRKPAVPVTASQEVDGT